MVARLELGAVPRNVRRHDDPVLRAMTDGFRASVSAPCRDRATDAILAALGGRTMPEPANTVPSGRTPARNISVPDD